ncbi:hypothetical protein D0T90_05900 [Neisseria animalis]|uniref:Uncharacterized protein n=1 Tax=Neisseria animalis TaxID=492 RepID=A0A5P3MSL7_NEIAN|nr:hypothetical protein D0T90_05900 [Neisseria animalis]ROW32654.1 hypothetical protein CGZ60_04240 [Neisseria animalis]
MPCRTMCTVCGFAALSHSYFIRLYENRAIKLETAEPGRKPNPAQIGDMRQVANVAKKRANSAETTGVSNENSSINT